MFFFMRKHNDMQLYTYFACTCACIPPRVCAKCDNSSGLYGLSPKQGLRKPPNAQREMYQEKAHAVDTCGHKDVVEASLKCQVVENDSDQTVARTLLCSGWLLWSRCCDVTCSACLLATLHQSLNLCQQHQHHHHHKLLTGCMFFNYILLSHDSTMWSGKMHRSHWLAK